MNVTSHISKRVSICPLSFERSMRIFHRLCVNQDRRPEFLRAGLDLNDHIDKKDLDSFVVVRISEADPRWPAISKLITRRHELDIVDTELDAEELNCARFVRFCSTSWTGFPEPSDDNSYLTVTYDLTAYCTECGAGGRQKAPFRILREPRWGRRTTFSTQLGP